MKKNKNFGITMLICIVINAFTFGQQISTNINKLEIPKTKSDDIIITHTGYSLLYNETYELASWVAYELTKDETTKVVERTNKFLPDPQVTSGTANDKDYEGYSYDRGHLAPAADMSWSSTTMAESFYYSNMSPQNPGFNRGVWKRLEELARSWAIENNSVYIVTGPVLTPGLPTIGTDKVAVPTYFYKVILDYSEPEVKGIGFILSNNGSGDPLQNFAVTIDSVEIFTGLDFFPLMPDDKEKSIESTLCISCWSWKNIQTKNENNSLNKNSTSVQCKGTTKAGERCKIKTLNASGYCYLHEYQLSNNSDQTAPVKTERRKTSVQCSGTTQAGNRCKHKTYSPNGKCFQHGGN